jgi:hypothetical protein
LSNRLWLIVVWTLIGFGVALAIFMGWRKLNPHRSVDQQILIDKAK